ncbi:MAG: LysM peptidoglycan-binding domain-containing protein [Granulosicoccus sp.]
MIAVSDAVLVLVSAAALGTGLYRWQNNVDQAMLANAPATIPVEVPSEPDSASNRQIAPSNELSGTASSTTNVQGNVPVNSSQLTDVLVVEPAPTTTTINVADDAATAASNNAVVDAPPYGSYIVRSGDSLSLIAQRYATTVQRLQEINDIQGTLINVGQQIRYPLPIN